MIDTFFVSNFTLWYNCTVCLQKYIKYYNISLITKLSNVTAENIHANLIKHKHKASSIISQGHHLRDGVMCRTHRQHLPS